MFPHYLRLLSSSGSDGNKWAFSSRLLIRFHHFAHILTNPFISSTCCDVITRDLEWGGFHWRRRSRGTKWSPVFRWRCWLSTRWISSEGKVDVETQQVWHENQCAMLNQDKPFQQHTVNAAHSLKCCLSLKSCYIERLCVAFVIFPSSHQQSTPFLLTSGLLQNKYIEK